MNDETMLIGVSDVTMVPLSVVVFALFAIAAATDVEQCPGKSFHDLANNVELLRCNKLPCRLKKGTKQHVSITFVPEKDLTELTNYVTATVLGTPLPFVGVNGYSVCDKIYLENGEKTSCPLKAGTKYTYKDSFPVLSFYPSINLRVHWGLTEGGKDVTCFEVPAKIS